jgi:hypothetical protein
MVVVVVDHFIEEDLLFYFGQHLLVFLYLFKI